MSEFDMMLDDSFCGLNERMKVNNSRLVSSLLLSSRGWLQYLTRNLTKISNVAELLNC